jgi:hypothetical protein
MVYFDLLWRSQQLHCSTRLSHLKYQALYKKVSIPLPGGTLYNYPLLLLDFTGFVTSKYPTFTLCIPFSPSNISLKKL